MKNSCKAFFSLAAAFLMLLTVVQVPALGTGSKGAAVIPQPEICAVQTAVVLPEPAAAPVPAAPAQIAVTNNAVQSGTDVFTKTAIVSPEPQTTQSNPEPAQTTAGEPQAILPGIIYDEVNSVLYGPNGKGLVYTGFDYDIDQKLFYASLNCWQKAFGYNNLYDALAPLGAMVFDTRSVYFSYGGVHWMIKLWKGQYGITSGAEVGIYRQSALSSAHYVGVGEEDFLQMDLTLYRHGELYFTREPQKHWWLSGFVMGDISIPGNLSLNTNITFKDTEMAGAFVSALSTREDAQDVLHTVDGSIVSLTWE